MVSLFLLVVLDGVYLCGVLGWYVVFLMGVSFVNRLFWVWLCLALSCVFSSGWAFASSMPEAVDGMLDARQWDAKRDGVLALNGGWRFHWKRLLPPAQAKVEQPTAIVKWPGLWGKTQINGRTLAMDGYGTYHLTLRLSSPMRLGLRLYRLYSSYRLFVNGRLVFAQGKVGTSPETSSIRVHPTVVGIDATERTEIVLQVANFAHRKGGPGDSILVGLPSQMHHARVLRVGYDVFIFTASFVIGLFYLILFFLLRRTDTPLYFALACLAVSFRSLVVSESFLLLLFPGLSYTFVLRIEYILIYASISFATLFMHKLYPKDSSLWVVRSLVAFWCLCLVFPLFFSPWVFTRSWWLLFATTPLFVLYILVVNIRAIWHKRMGAIVILFCSMLCGLGSLYDVWGYRTGALNLEVAQLGVLAFIVGQAWLLALRFSRAYGAAELLAHNLELKNSHLLVMNEASNRFVPSDLLRLLGKENIAQVELSQHVHKDMAILFSDVRGFTTLSEGMTARENFDFVNEVMGRISPIIREHNGIVIKYLGDGLMAVFPDGVEDAIAAAMAKLREVERYNQSNAASDGPVLKLGVGINYGAMSLGMVGEPGRIQGDVLSDAVNLAARVEGMTKKYGVELLITGSVYEQLHDPDAYLIRELDRVKPKGKSIPVTVYEVFDCLPDDVRNKRLGTREQLAACIALYRDQSFEQALVMLEKAKELDPDDLVFALYEERCQRRMLGGVTMDWDGVESWETK